MPITGRWIRDTILGGCVALACAFAGYFLTHRWQTMSELMLGLLLGGVLFVYAGARFARVELPRARLGWIAVALGLAALFFVDPRSAGAGILVLASGLAGPAASPIVRLVLAFVLASAAGWAGLCAGEMVPLSHEIISVFALAGYVGAASSLRGGPPVGRGLLTAIITVIAAGLVAMVVLGLYRPMAFVVGLFGIWLLVYITLFGVKALKKPNAVRIILFSDHALGGIGLLAAALLAFPLWKEQTAELAWPVIAGLFSMLVLRLWPYICRKTASVGRAPMEKQ